MHCADKKTRINTNGQANLIHGRDVTDVVVDSCDVINVSLNQCSAKKYDEVCRSVYGEKAFDALLEFASLCKSKGGNVVFSVVDVIGGEGRAKVPQHCRGHGHTAAREGEGMNLNYDRQFEEIKKAARRQQASAARVLRSLRHLLPDENTGRL